MDVGKPIGHLYERRNGGRFLVVFSKLSRAFFEDNIAPWVEDNLSGPCMYMPPYYAVVFTKEDLTVFLLKWSS